MMMDNLEIQTLNLPLSVESTADYSYHGIHETDLEDPK